MTIKLTVLPALALLAGTFSLAPIAAADECGDPDTSAICQRILGEEMAMADWLGENLPTVTAKFLSLEQMPDGTAKR